MYPGQVPLHRVNWIANKSFEYVGNYKILQTAFTKLKIDRHIDVDRLISGRAMDNLEFMQWFKRYFELQVGVRGSEYDPTAARSRGKGGTAYRWAAGASSSQAAAARSNTAPATTETRRGGAAANSKENKSTGANRVGGAPSRAGGGKAPVAAQAAEVVALKGQATAMKLEMDGLERERDFYFNKLRDIEIMLQDIEDSGKGTELTADIFKILYATAEGFVQSPSAASVASQHMNSPARSSTSKSAVAPSAVAGSTGKANLFTDSTEEIPGPPPDEEGDDDEGMLSPGAVADNPFKLSAVPSDI